MNLHIFLMGLIGSVMLSIKLIIWFTVRDLDFSR